MKKISSNYCRLFNFLIRLPVSVNGKAKKKGFLRNFCMNSTSSSVLDFLYFEIKKILDFFHSISCDEESFAAAKLNNVHNELFMSTL